MTSQLPLSDDVFSDDTMKPFIARSRSAYDLTLKVLRALWMLLQKRRNAGSQLHVRAANRALARLCEEHFAFRGVVLACVRGTWRVSGIRYHFPVLTSAERQTLCNLCSNEQFNCVTLCESLELSVPIVRIPHFNTQGELKFVTFLFCERIAAARTIRRLEKKHSDSTVHQLSVALQNNAVRSLPFDFRSHNSLSECLDLMCSRISRSFRPYVVDAVLWQVDLKAGVAWVIASSGYDDEYRGRNALITLDSFVGAVAQRPEGFVGELDDIPSADRYVRKDKAIPMRLSRAVAVSVGDCKLEKFVLVLNQFGTRSASTDVAYFPSPEGLRQIAGVIQDLLEEFTKSRSDYLEQTLASMPIYSDGTGLQRVTDFCLELFNASGVRLIFRKGADSKSCYQVWSGFGSDLYAACHDFLNASLEPSRVEGNLSAKNWVEVSREGSQGHIISGFTSPYSSWDFRLQIMRTAGKPPFSAKEEELALSVLSRLPAFHSQAERLTSNAACRDANATRFAHLLR